MKNHVRTFSVVVSLSAALPCLMPPVAWSQMRTPWQMIDTTDVFPFASNGLGDPNAYQLATVPAQEDPAWGPAPDLNTIDFDRNSAPGMQSYKCKDALNFSYFQCFVFIPSNYPVTTFAVTIGFVDDGDRVSLYNSAYPNGGLVPGSYIFGVRGGGGSGTANLASLLVRGETNRLVITHQDDCWNGSACRGVSVLLNGAPVNQQPVALCTNVTIVLGANATVCATNVSINHGSYDPDAGNTITLNQIPPPPYPIGSTLVRLWVRDNYGASNSCTATVLVIDAKPPSIICPGDLTLAADPGSCFASFVGLGTPTVSDCSTVTVTNNAPARFSVGTSVVTWTARDASGNASTCQQRIIVSDTQPPAITCPPDVTVATDPGSDTASNVSLGPPMINENCVALVTNDAPASYPLGTNRVTWTVSDASGHTNVCQQRVIVVTTPPPQISCPADVTVNASAGSCFATNVSLGSPTITAPGCGSVVVTSNAPAQFPVGETTVTWTATDGCGNFSVCLQRVTVRDPRVPGINCPANLVLATDPGQCSRSNVTYGVTFTTNCAGAATLTQLAGLASGQPFPKGPTTNAFNVTDASGNTNLCGFTVTIIDSEPPAITCPAEVTAYALPGATNAEGIALGTPFVGDNCGVAGITNNAPERFPIGTTLVSWTATDTSGNITTCHQQVIVNPACSGVLFIGELVDVALCPCGVADFGIATYTPDPVTFTWWHDGQLIAGATNRTLTLAGLQPSDEGVYSVEARTACAMATSSAALYVLPAVGTSPVSYTNSTPISILSDGPGFPYPTVITPECVPGFVTSLTVTLLGFWHAFPADVSVLLVSPDRTRAIKLMSGAGDQYAVAGVNLTFSDGVNNPLPRFDTLADGVYSPTDYDTNATFVMPAPAPPYVTNFAAFNGADPNGGWALYVLDGVPLDGGGLDGWSLDLQWQPAGGAALLNPRRLVNGGFQVQLRGVVGVTYFVQGSTNLTSWFPVSTHTVTTPPGDLLVDLPPSQSPSQFYRVLNCH